MLLTTDSRVQVGVMHPMLHLLWTHQVQDCHLPPQRRALRMGARLPSSRLLVVGTLLEEGIPRAMRGRQTPDSVLLASCAIGSSLASAA